MEFKLGSRSVTRHTFCLPNVTGRSSLTEYMGLANAVLERVCLRSLCDVRIGRTCESGETRYLEG